MTRDYLIHQVFLNIYVLLSTLIADERKAHLIPIETLDLFQIERRGFCLNPAAECLVFLCGEGESRLVGIRNARDGRSGIALCNLRHGAKTAALVWKEVSVDLPPLRDAMHMNGRF